MNKPSSSPIPLATVACFISACGAQPDECKPVEQAGADISAKLKEISELFQKGEIFQPETGVALYDPVETGTHTDVNTNAGVNINVTPYAVSDGKVAQCMYGMVTYKTDNDLPLSVESASCAIAPVEKTDASGKPVEVGKADEVGMWSGSYGAGGAYLQKPGQFAKGADLKTKGCVEVCSPECGTMYAGTLAGIRGILSDAAQRAKQASASSQRSK